MTGSERRAKIIQILEGAHAPVAAKALAMELGVSRQIIVSDVALLRARNHEITSTNKGYVLTEDKKVERVFKVIHSDTEVEEELNLFVDYGGCVKDIFIYHKTYGTVRAEMNIKSRKDVMDFLDAIASGKSKLLKNVTSGYHYHTVTASSEAILDLIQIQLQEKGFLASLQDYEPVNFWNKEEP